MAFHLTFRSNQLDSSFLLAANIFLIAKNSSISSKKFAAYCTGEIIFHYSENTANTAAIGWNLVSSRKIARITYHAQRVKRRAQYNKLKQKKSRSL